MLTDEQRAALLRDAALTNPRVFRYIWLAMHTIVRRGSLCHVTKADIDLTTGTIVYRRTKNGVEIRVPLIPVCLDEVKAWLAEPGPLLHKYRSPTGITQAFRRIKDRLARALALRAATSRSTTSGTTRAARLVRQESICLSSRS